MQLSKNFTLAELVESQTATRKNIDNTPAPAVIANLARIAALLEQVRALVGAPLTVSSGYRSPALNRAIGGAASSAHVLGLAADISTPKLSPRALAMLIRQSGLVFDQLIYEGTWVHIGLSTGAPRNQVLTARFGAGGTTYVTGIV
ncbi:D-Ala-D-Ala carboxypeptidase family metallohydrolase [Janthinobacterium psychrotolerans]|uniref:Peptidase M15 n=1 Tax=Janthinobacterium psychrotolerans TaxID=1747903 RepID=A0A1A7C221_9BURK|nr:D-Ala-D-Ala carboxypeptidase family metallohydrolase [Janthinobacterium psychrotolerans]OBV39782.1 Peptidase M15 [Janthinobacterium psychrotolerans]